MIIYCNPVYSTILYYQGGKYWLMDSVNYRIPRVLNPDYECDEDYIEYYASIMEG